MLIFDFIKTHKMKHLNYLLLILFTTTFSSCTLGRYVWYNAAEVDDYKHFEQRKINANKKAFKFPYSQNKIIIDSIFPKKSIKVNGKTINSLKKHIEKSGTLAFIIIKNDSIVSEEYFNGHSKESISGSFSMAKSVVSLLIGCAIEDSYIDSEKDSITKYLPELSKNGFDDITIEHLLQMTSGIKFSENYWLPFAHAGNFYYGRNLWKETLKLKKKYKPGEHFDYRSGDTQILGFILNRVLNDITLSKYLEKKIWRPLGMEYNASWLIDSKGMERAFVGINATALDFAKIGKLVLNNGNWNGKQIIQKEWIIKSFEINSSNKNPQTNDYVYQYQWYLKDKGKKGIYAFGYRGQCLYFNKSSNTVMIRLGKKHGEMDWDELFYAISKTYE